MTYVRRTLLLVLALVAAALPLSASAEAAAAARPPSSVNILIGAHEGGGLGAMAADDETFYRLDSRGRSFERVRFVARFTGLDPSDTNLLIRYSVTSTVPTGCGGELWNWDTSQWTVVLFFNTGPTEVDITAVLSADAYVNPNGVMKLKTSCSTESGEFVLKIDQLTAETATDI